jgi:extracellular elastinolytic metalloproteinase
MRTLTNISCSGNNALSYKGVQANVTTESQEGLTFIYVQNASAAPTTEDNLAAARVNTFYLVNKFHDIVYKYGFTETAFNFQNDNFNKGGKAFDRVIVSVQTSPGTDNAYFTTPPDGVNGQMHLYLFDYTSPMRDGALENDIVVHEVCSLSVGFQQCS